MDQSYQDKNEDKNQIKIVDLNKKQLVVEYERIYNAWITAGLFALVGGLYVADTLSKGSDSVIIKYFGIMLILGSISLFTLAYWDYRTKIKEIKGKENKGVSVHLTGALTFVLILGSILSLILIFQL